MPPKLTILVLAQHRRDFEDWIQAIDPSEWGRIEFVSSSHVLFGRDPDLTYLVPLKNYSLHPDYVNILFQIRELATLQGPKKPFKGQFQI